MSLIFESRFRAWSNEGAILPLATLTVYDAGTNDLADVFTTSALSTPLTNPVVADAEGWFAQLFANEGTTFDLVLKTAGGVTVKTYEDVPSLGPEANTFSRDFGLGGRIAITGSAGTIRIAAGPASPDDTGGALEITGQAGTQLETLRLHSDMTTISGGLRSEGQTYLALEDALTVEGGKNYEGLVITPATTFSAVASVDIALSASYDVCEVELIDIEGAFSILDLQVSFDNASTFKSAASDYTYTTLTGTGSTAGSTENVVTDRIRIGAHNNLSGLRTCLKLEVITTSTASKATQINFQGLASSDLIFGTGHTKNSYGRATHIRVFINTATFSGRYRVVGKKGW